MSGTATAKHPRGLYVLFLTEMWERFGYYLMVGIFFLYMTASLSAGGRGFDDAKALGIVGSYVALVYLTPFLGGLLADKILGYRFSIILGGLLMSAGYFGLAIPTDSAMYISCLLIIVGNGFFKPNISTLLGNLYNKEELMPLKDSAYNIFYMGINVGAFFCNFAAAILRNNFGWGYAFSAAGVGLLIGLVFFITGTRHIKDADIRKPTEKGDMKVSQVLLYVFAPAIIFGIIGWIIPGTITGDNATDAFLFACVPITVFYIMLWVRAKQHEKRGIGALLTIFFVSIVFWIIYNQNATGLTIWAQTYTNRATTASVGRVVAPFKLLQNIDTTPKKVEVVDHYFRAQKDANGKVLEHIGIDPYFQNLPKKDWPKDGKLSLVNAEIFQSVNPLFIILLTPLVVAVFGFFMRRGNPISTPMKVVWSMIFTGLSALVMVYASHCTDIYTTKVSSIWLISTYGIFTIGELFISPIGLSLVSKLAPQRFTALMMGGWFLTTAIGGKISGILASMWDKFTDKGQYFYILAALCLVAMIVMLFMVKGLKKIVKEKTGHY